MEDYIRMVVLETNSCHLTHDRKLERTSDGKKKIVIIIWYVRPVISYY